MTMQHFMTEQRRALLYVLCLLLLGIGLSGASLEQLGAAETSALPTPERSSAVFYPFKIGNEWDYLVETAGQLSSVTNKVAKVETIDGMELYRLDASVGGTVVATEHVLHDDKGLHRCRLNGGEFTPPILLLKNPPTPNTSWEADTKNGGQTYRVKSEIGDEVDVTVPAGTFRALKVRLSLTFEGVNVESDYWFAKDVGIVKQTLSIGDQNTTLSLSKFHVANSEAE